MDTAELLKKVRKVEIKTRGLSQHLFTGGYHSAFKGRGMSFSEVRGYSYGDDVRNIDWNVTARTGEPFVKIYEEERELTVMLLVDVSGSAFFGSGEQFKNDIITEICAVLAFSAITNNDKVGVLFFSDQPQLFIPPRKGRQHILRIIRELLNVTPSGQQTDLGGAMRYLENMLKKRSVCFVISDFMAKDFDAPLRILAKRHDLIGVHVFDPREKTLPDIGLVPTIDAETGAQRWIDTGDAALRQDYMQHFLRNTVLTQNAFNRAGADFISIATVDSYTQALLKFFEKRTH